MPIESGKVNMKSVSLSLVSHCLVGALCARAGISYNESVAGDLSDNRLLPTPLSLRYGSNLVSGKFGRSPDAERHDLDYVTITIPPGRSLAQLVLVQADVGGAVSFIAVQNEPQFTVPYTTFDSTVLLGWHHFGSSEQGFDILPALGAGPGSMGFVPPLAAGVYTFWLQEINTEDALDYSLDFQVAAANGCPADLAFNAFVDDADFVVFAGAYNILDCADPAMPAWCPADLNGDAFVDDADFVQFVAAYDEFICP
jgi:hypothetical protein